jgi:hypothetical protein
MKLKAKLPKEEANGIDAFETELAANLRNGKTVPAIVLLGTEDVLERNNVPITVITDIEGVPEDLREQVLNLMGKIRSDRTGQITGATALDLDDPDGAI